MLSNNSLEDLPAGFMRVKNKVPEVEMHSKDLAAFSESINESRLQDDYSDGRPNIDDNKIQFNGKGSKRKAGEMERKAAAVEIQSRKKIEQDSRIVRLSQLTGSKDRHSKVRTAKGLRDRRVRLSGPTAIQLYDLQDRLCLDQPSMAVDWLIKAAKSAIDELNVLDEEMASASAGLAQLTSSNCSNVEHCVGSPRESATAAAASGLTAFRVGLSSPKAQETDSHNAINGKVISITNLKESDLGRSSSSTSDESIKGSAEHTSNCSMSKPAASRREARLKARERARKKSASAQNSIGSPPSIQQLNSMPSSFTSMFKSSFPYPTLPLESPCHKYDNPCGIQTQVLSGIDSVQQLWGYNNMPSYTDMLCTQESHPLQNMPSYSTAALQKSLPAVPSTSASIQAVTGSSCLQSYEMADSAISFFYPKEIRHLGSNGAQGQPSLCYSNTANLIMKSTEQQQAQMHIRHFGSTFVPTFSNDTHFSTSSLSARGPLQSNSSCITNMPSLSHILNNAYGEPSAKTAHDNVSLRDYDDRVFQEFRNAQDNVKYGHNIQLWSKEKEHL